MLEVALVRDIAEFDQHRRHVGRLQHLETGRLQRVLVHPHRGLHLAHQRRANRFENVRVSRCASSIRMSATSVGSSVRLTPADGVGLVFGFREPLRLGVGGLVGQRVDGGALGVALAPRQAHRHGSTRTAPPTGCGRLHAVGERNEGIVGAGHDDAIFARSSRCDRATPGQIAAPAPFRWSPLGLGAIVDAAMAGIDHHHRARIRGCGRLRRRARGSTGTAAVGIGIAGFSSGRFSAAKRLNEGGAVDLLEFEHQPRRLAVGGLQHVGFCNFGRTGQIEHDPGAARHHQAIAERLDQAATAVPAPASS